MKNTNCEAPEYVMFSIFPEKWGSYLMIRRQIFHLEAIHMALKSEGKLKKVEICSVSSEPSGL